MALTEFIANTKAKSSEVNSNFKGGVIHEVYTGTGYDTSITTATTDEQSYEMTSISSTNLGSTDYLVIRMLIDYSVNGSGVSDVSLKIQTKDIGGSYSDSLPYKLLMRGNVENDTSNVEWIKEVTWVHTLTNDEKTNGVQVKIFSKSYSDSASGIPTSVTNVQTVSSSGIGL